MMKNSILVLVASVGFATSACAQIKVPEVVKSSFQKEYPGVKVKWEKEGLNYEAGFKQKGHEMSIVYSPNGVSTEKEMEIPVSDLPKAVRDYVAQNYKGAKVKEAAKITKSNGAVQYEAEIKGKDVLFTPEGKLISAATEKK